MSVSTCCTGLSIAKPMKISVLPGFGGANQERGMEGALH
jgi:hypothetical protein